VRCHIAWLGPGWRRRATALACALLACAPTPHASVPPSPPKQLVAGKLADMYTLTAASRAYVSTVAAQADAGSASRKDCAAVILHNAEAATRVALDAIQVGRDATNVGYNATVS
jgi:alkylation response protein AidB-like acyl-CoA dehydrogenase